MPLGSEAKFCLGFGVGAKFEVGVCAKLEAGFGVGAKTGSGVGRGGGGEGGWGKSLGSKSFDILVVSSLQPSINAWTTNVKYQPVGPEKVLDLAQCRQWSAGELGCLAAMLRPVLSPIIRVVRMMGMMVRMMMRTTIENMRKNGESP